MNSAGSHLNVNEADLITCTETAKLLTRTRPHFNNCHWPGVGLPVFDAPSSLSASEIPLVRFPFIYSLSFTSWGCLALRSVLTVQHHPAFLNKLIFCERQDESPTNQIYKNVVKKMVAVQDQDQET